MAIINPLLLSISLCLISTQTIAQSVDTFSQGETIFRKAGGYGCSTCHGLFAHGGGNVGGNIRGKTLAQINQRLDNEPTMQLLSAELSAQDRQLLADYLAELGKRQLLEWEISDTAADSVVTLSNSAPVQLVITNKLLTPITVNLNAIGITVPATIQPYETQAYDWQPQQETLWLKHANSRLTINLQ